MSLIAILYEQDPIFQGNTIPFTDKMYFLKLFYRIMHYKRENLSNKVAQFAVKT